MIIDWLGTDVTGQGSYYGDFSEIAWNNSYVALASVAYDGHQYFIDWLNIDPVGQKLYFGVFADTVWNYSYVAPAIVGAWTRSNAKAYAGSYSIASPGNGAGAGTVTYKQDSEISVQVGTTYSFSAYVWSDTPNQARISATLDSTLIFPATADGSFTADGSITAGGRELIVYSSYHPGGSSWQKLEAICTVINGNLIPKVSFHKEVSPGQAYFDNCQLSSTGLYGTYVSPTYDRGSVVTRRCWPEFDLLFVGTGAAWWDQFSSSAIWTSKFGPSDTWLWLFGAFIAGTLKMRLGYSTDNVNFTWVDYFESYVVEIQARYVKYEIQITDVQVDGFLYVKPMTYKEAYWA